MQHRVPREPDSISENDCIVDFLEQVARAERGDVDAFAELGAFPSGLNTLPPLLIFNLLGRMYLQGDYVRRDHEEARRWLVKAKAIASKRQYRVALTSTSSRWTLM